MSESTTTMQEKVNQGRYVIQHGQTMSDVSTVVYGDPNRIVWLLDANVNSAFDPGDVIKVPNKKGVVLYAQDGDGFASLFQRELPGRAFIQYKDLIHKWNGGYDVDVLEEGTPVFVPDRQVTGY